jgi:RNA polymerase sigma factor (sigma-70 family)
MSRPSTESIDCVPLLSADDLARLIHVHGRRLRNFIRRRVGNMADVDDLVQDTCLEALRSLHNYRGNSRPETWLFGIAMNLVRGHYKHAHTRTMFVEEEAGFEAQEDMSEDPLDTLARNQEIERMFRLVEGLPVNASAVLTLVFDERLTYEQAASRLHIPVGTVRSRISRVRALLRNKAPSQVPPSKSLQAQP